MKLTEFFSVHTIHFRSASLTKTQTVFTICLAEPANCYSCCCFSGYFSQKKASRGACCLFLGLSLPEPL